MAMSNVTIAEFLSSELVNNKQISAKAQSLVDALKVYSQYEVSLDGRARLTVDGNFKGEVSKLLRDLINELGLIVNKEITPAGKWTFASEGLLSSKQKAVASALGDYFEAAVYFAILEKLPQLIDNEDYAQSMIRKDKIYYKLLGYFSSKTTTDRAIEELQSAAENAANQVIQQEDLQHLDTKRHKSIQWMGGSGGIGDLKIQLDDLVLMVECKYYSAKTIEDLGISYFTFSDADATNFGVHFYSFLKSQKEPLWYEKNQVPTSSWLSTVATYGMLEYVQKSAGSRVGKDIMAYLLQKGSHYNITNYFNATHGKRALVTGVKASKGKVSCTLDLNAVVTDKGPISISQSQWATHFKGPKGELATLSIPGKSQKVIQENSHFSDPNADGPGWDTTFHYQLTKLLLDPFK